MERVEENDEITFVALAVVGNDCVEGSRVGKRFHVDTIRLKNLTECIAGDEETERQRQQQTSRNRRRPPLSG